MYSLPALHEKEEDETDGHQNYEMPRSEILVINHPIWYLLRALKLFYAKDNADSSSLFVLSVRVRIHIFEVSLKTCFGFISFRTGLLNKSPCFNHDMRIPLET